MRLRRLIPALAAMTCLATAPTAARAVTVGQVDTFTSGLQGWAGGQAVERITSGGPGGAGDSFLRVESFGVPGNTGKLVFFNQEQWTGDFAAAGVTGVSMDVRNLGATNLMLRIAMGNAAFPGASGNLGDWMVSTVPVNLPAMSSWTSIMFPISAGDFSGDPYSAIINDVLAMRIVHAETTADPGKGEDIAALLGVDNITALGSAPAIPGDFNGVGGVTGADLDQWRGDYGLNGESDADDDGDSDGNDFIIWQRHLGEGASVAAMTGVPEPSSIALAVVTLLAGAYRRVRTRARS